MHKVIVVGLDSAPPELVFGAWLDELPTLRQLVGGGLAGPLQSCVPPITVPAWAAMMSGRDPGELGLYGFRNRVDRSYQALAVANALHVTTPRLWDILSRSGRRVIVLGVPQTYPPLPVNGWLVSCFLTPEGAPYTYPRSLAAELEAQVGEYRFDVRGFRANDKARILHDAHHMTACRFRVARHLATTRTWDFFMLVEIGVDRMQHAFWQYLDPSHPKYEDDATYRTAVFDYYRRLDAELGQFLDAIHGDAAVLVVSDHGAKTMYGGLALNEWLIQEGYLVLRAMPATPMELQPEMVDWARTLAWGAGGYYGRVFLNVHGREPTGAVSPDGYESLRDELAGRLAAIRDHRDAPLKTRAWRPEQLYRTVSGVPPDLLVYFDDLGWRAVGSVGLGTVHTFDNDTGPDGANHAEYGIFIGAHAPERFTPGTCAAGLTLYDVAPTILSLFDLPIPEEMTGRVIGRQEECA